MKLILDDNELVERLQKGNVEAFDIIYNKYSGKLYAFGFKYLRSTAEAEELVQSVFLKVWENYKNLKKESSFKSYLFTIAYNDICKLFRKRSYRQKFIEDTLYDNSQSSIETETDIDFKFTLDQVQKIVEKLPKRQKNIFLKSRNEGKSTKEIAVEVGLSPGTVDNYISDALKFIRISMHNENLTVLLLLCTFFF